MYITPLICNFSETMCARASPKKRLGGEEIAENWQYEEVISNTQNRPPFA